MRRIDDETVRPGPSDAVVEGRALGDDEAEGTDAGTGIPVEPINDVDEWLADEAGYGYGV